MKDQVLSIKQMQHLKELGIDISKASMFWIINRGSHCKDFPYPITNNHKVWRRFLNDCNYKCEAFTLQDMIELMPDKVIKDDTEFYLIIDKKCTGYIDMKEEYLVHKSFNEILANCYNMLVWLAENKYINKDEK